MLAGCLVGCSACSPGLPFPAFRRYHRKPLPPTPAPSPNKMAATPSAEWDRLKWRRRNYVRRQADAQLVGGKMCGTPARTSGRSPEEKAGLHPSPVPRARSAPPTKGRGQRPRSWVLRGFAFETGLPVTSRAAPSAFGADATHARISSRACPTLSLRRTVQNVLPGTC